MTNQEINIAIAEEMGWTDVHFSLASFIESVLGERCIIGIPPGCKVHKQAPSYTSDLNACAEMWLSLKTRHERFRFHEELRRAVINSGGHASSTDGDIDCCCENATALQRCEAFLRVKGKWK